MFRGFTAIFSKSNKDLRHRIYFTLFCLGLFCLGTTVTVPWASRITEGLGVLEIFNLMSGGGLQNVSIFALGVSPYITASIITQLLEMDIIPYFKELKDQGYVGRQKINKITRYLAIIFAFIQAYALCIFYIKTFGTVEIVKTALVMTAGTSFCLWLGDQITKKGIGNGTSMIIMAGIMLSMGKIFTGAYKTFIGGSYSLGLGILFFAIFILVYLIVLVGIIYIQLAERRIPIQYSNRTTSAYGAEQSYLPIKINAAGVIPVIFAQILLTIPATIVGLIGNTRAMAFIQDYIVYSSNTGIILYILLIIFFGYFYTFMIMNPEEMSKNLNERGGYIPGIRPGVDTSNYVSKSLSRLTIVGSIFLTIIAILPVVMGRVFTNLPNTVTIGGTGLLIVVGVAIETYKQMESSLMARSYKEKRRRIR